MVMNDDLRRMAETVQLSRSTHAELWQNIMLALGIKTVFLVLAVLAPLNVDGSVCRHGVSLLVVLTARGC